MKRLFLSLFLLLVGCGQSGDLYLPGTKANSITKAADPLKGFLPTGEKRGSL